MQTAHEIFGEVISSYSRSQAIEDGYLVDVSETAREAGIRFPVALTRAVWDAYVEVPPKAEGQDEAGRLWDVLWMLRDGIMLRACLAWVLYRNGVKPDSLTPAQLRAIADALG